MPPKNGSTKASPAQQVPEQRQAHEMRLGRIKATIWANQSEGGTCYNVTISRSYKDDDEWKSSASFGRNELLTVAKAADLANTWIHNQSQGPPTNGSGRDDAHDDILY